MLFNCRYTLGEILPTLEQDMSQRCYSKDWWFTAIIGLTVFIVYTLGFPGVLLWLLRASEYAHVRASV